MIIIQILITFTICSIGMIAVLGEEKLMIASKQKEMLSYVLRVISGAFIFSVIALWIPGIIEW